MPIQGRYIGRTQYNYQGMNIIHNKVYSIEIFPNCNGYPWIVRIYDTSIWGKIIKFFTGYTKEKAWIPYNECPNKYWIINIDIDFKLIKITPQSKACPFLPSL